MEDAMAEKAIKNVRLNLKPTNKLRRGRMPWRGNNLRTSTEVGVSMLCCQDEEVGIFGAVRLCWQVEEFIGMRMLKALNSK